MVILTIDEREIELCARQRARTGQAPETATDDHHTCAIGHGQWLTMQSLSTPAVIPALQSPN